MTCVKLFFSRNVIRASLVKKFPVLRRVLLKNPPVALIGTWATVFESIENGSFHMISHANGDSFSGSLKGTTMSFAAEMKSPEHVVGLGMPPWRQRIYGIDKREYDPIENMSSRQTLSSMIADNGRTSNTELIASQTSLPNISPNFPRHSLTIRRWATIVPINMTRRTVLLRMRTKQWQRKYVERKKIIIIMNLSKVNSYMSTNAIMMIYSSTRTRICQEYIRVKSMFDV
jgi:hypothetical protein